MAVSETTDVVLGPYVDYDLSGSMRKQILVSTKNANIWTNFIGILITIALARLVTITYCILRAIFKIPVAVEATANLASAANVPLTPVGGHSFLDDIDQYSVSAGWLSIMSGVNKAFNRPPTLPATSNTRGIRTRMRDCFSSRAWRLWWYRHEAVQDICHGTIIFIGYTGSLICGIVAAKIATTDTALSNSPQCGFYFIPENLTLLNTPYEFVVQSNAATYAKNCYGIPKGTDPCDIFISRNIEYKIEHNISCPFGDNMCFYEIDSAFRLFTGPVSERVLGLNAPKVLDFRRNCSCSPLKMDSRFIRKITDSNVSKFNYYYGAVDNQTESWTTRSSNGIPSFPTYQLGSVVSGIEKGWQPIPGLQPPIGSVTSLIFIRSGAVYYLNPRDDPIFPAQEPIRFPHINRTLYWNDLDHATVLGCVDSTEWRDPAFPDIWKPAMDLNISFQFDRQSMRAMWIMKISLMNSIIYQSLSRRMTAALEVQNILETFIPLAVSREQWKSEITQLFEVSLARIQYDMHDFARGTRAKYPDYVKFTPNDIDICQNTYLIPSRGYTNLNYNWTIGLGILSVVLILLSLPSPNHPIWVEPAIKYIWKTSAAQKLAKLCLLLFELTHTIALAVWNRLHVKQWVSSAWRVLKRLPEATLVACIRGTRAGIQMGKRVGTSWPLSGSLRL